MSPSGTGDTELVEAMAVSAVDATKPISISDTIQSDMHHQLGHKVTLPRCAVVAASNSSSAVVEGNVSKFAEPVIAINNKYVHPPRNDEVI